MGETMSMQRSMGFILSLGLFLTGSMAYSGGSSRFIDSSTGLEIRRDSIDDPNPTPIPFPDELEQQELEVRWSPIKTDSLGNVVILSGKLLLVGEADMAAPLRNQTFSIYLAKQSERQLDWSEKAIYEETVMVDGFSDANGNFEGTVNLSDTELTLDKIGNVQIAIAPASISMNGKDRWGIRQNDRPAISSSVKMLVMPAAPRMAPATIELNRLLRWPEDDLDGTQLLRTALSLQIAGKDSALAAINAFIDGRIDKRSRRVGGLDDECVVGMITHLVFEPKEGSPLPPSYVCLFDFKGRRDSEALMKQWPNGSIMFAGGIPFVSGRHGYGFMGMLPPIDRFSEWILEHGQIRSQSFEPTMDPLNAAERILTASFVKAIMAKSEDPHDCTVQVNHIRRQALAMVGLPINPERPHFAGPEIHEDLWIRLIEETRTNPIVWDSKMLRFDASESSSRYQQLIDEAMRSSEPPCDE